MAIKKLPEVVVVAVAGVGRSLASEVAVDFHIYKPGGGVELKRHKARLRQIIPGVKIWDSYQHIVWDLLRTAGPNGASTWLGPGADVDAGIGALHYRPLMKSGIMDEIHELVPPYDMYQFQGGANVAPFQAAVQCFVLKKLIPLPRSACMHCDRITWLATGVPGRARSMARSNGIDDKRARELFVRLDLLNWWNLLNEPSYFDEPVLHVAVNGCWFMPADHDSPPTRELLYAAPTILAGRKCDGALIAGGWTMPSSRLRGKKVITPDLFKIGAAQEGINNGASWIMNSICSGPLFTALKELTKWSYSKISKEALAFLPWNGRELELVNKTPVDSAQNLLNEFGPSRAFAVIIHMTAKQPLDDLSNLAQATGQPVPKVVAVGNGFSENPTYLEAIRMRGFVPFVPCHSQHATADAGFAKLMSALLDISFKDGVRMAWNVRDNQPMASVL